MLLQVLSIIVICQSAIKFLNLIRYNESFCFLVEMLVQVALDIYPFCIVLFTFCAVFVMVTLVLEHNYPTDAYPYMNPLTIIILQTFRNSVGDLSEPKDYNWIDHDLLRRTDYLYKITGLDIHAITVYQNLLIGITWFFFIANIFIMQIVLLNFLIAEVSMTYGRINELGSCLMFQKKQELNYFVLKVFKYMGKKDPYKALVFVSPKTLQDEEHHMGFLKSFREDTVYAVKQMRHELLEN